MKGRIRGFPWKGAAALVIILLACLAVPLGIRLLGFWDRFIMVTVEESSTAAVVSWPLLMERLPGVYLDCTSSTLVLPRDTSLAGVCLGLHYSAVSQGIEFKDSIFFSRTGRVELGLEQSISLKTEGFDGKEVEMVDNGARVLAGDLKVEGASRDGVVRFKYGDARFSLKPGESWAEMLALTPDGLKAIQASNWDVELRACLRNGYPATRLAITNRGFWPKAGVKAGTAP